MEPFFPLHVLACERCYLVQLEAFVPPDEIFTEYAYFSAYSTAWVEHARDYVEDDPRAAQPWSATTSSSSSRRTTATCCSTSSARGIPILGIDPAANVAAAAEERGVPTLVAFFGAEVARELAAEGKRASLVVGNNVLAQVPDLNDFVAGVQILLRERRHGDVRVPAPAAPARRAAVRHDLPRALLVLLARDDLRDLPRTRARGLRRRGAVDARRLAPGLRAARRRPARDLGRRCRSCSRARSARGCARRSATRDSPRR